LRKLQNRKVFEERGQGRGRSRKKTLESAEAQREKPKVEGGKMEKT